MKIKGKLQKLQKEIKKEIIGKKVWIVNGCRAEKITVGKIHCDSLDYMVSPVNRYDFYDEDEFFNSKKEAFDTANLKKQKREKNIVNEVLKEIKEIFRYEELDKKTIDKIIKELKNEKTKMG